MIIKRAKSELVLALTWAFRFDQVEHLAEQILKGQRFDAHPLHSLTLFFIEILQLKHGQDAVTINIHAAEPVLYTGERNDNRVTHCIQTKTLINQDKNRTFLRDYIILPGGIFLVFLRYEEPHKLCIAHPAFPLHSITPGNNRDRAICIQYCYYGEVISSSVLVYVCVSTYRVTAPENNLSMILFEDAVRGENEKNKQMWFCSNTKKQMVTVVNLCAYSHLRKYWVRELNFGYVGI